MPRGSVRAILTLGLVAVSAATLFVHIVDDRAVGMLFALTVMAVKDYFGVRAAQNAEDGPPSKPYVNEG
jgi:hypothetical protein